MTRGCPASSLLIIREGLYLHHTLTASTPTPLAVAFYWLILPPPTLGLVPFFLRGITANKRETGPII